MNQDSEYGRILSFNQSGEELRSKAAQAARAGDILRALKWYRTAIEQDPDDAVAGMEYAVLLLRCGCWRSSLRESCRLLSRFPGEEKYYGLVYRNLLALEENRSACAAYERYMLHLYHHPDDGLNLNEQDPPVPPPPTRNRFHRLLKRIHRQLEKGDVNRASYLLAHANRSIFPAKDPVRDLLEIQLMTMTGLQQEAVDMVDGMVQAGELNASQALALIPLMHPLTDAAFTTRLLIYAVTGAETPVEVFDTVQECLRCRQPKLAISLLETLLQQQPNRLDCLYDLAAIAIRNGDVDTALDYARICYRTDPVDADVSFFYRLLVDAQHMNLDLELLKKLPVALSGSAVTPASALCRPRYQQLLEDPAEAAEELVQWSEQCRLMDLSAQMPDLHLRLIDCAAHMPAKERCAFLRMLLLCGNPHPLVVKAVRESLKECGSTEDVAYIRRGVLTVEPLDKDEIKEV